MADATWAVYVDWNSDGDFGDANEDITSYVMSMNWNVGFRQAFQNTAGENELTIQLRNDDKRFSPEYASSPLYGSLKPFRLIKVESTYSAVTRVHWYGWIDVIRPEWNERGSLVATITCHCLKRLLDGLAVNDTRPADIELLENTTADVAIQTIINDVQVPAVAVGNWRIGITGASEIGQTTYIADVTAGYSLETGVHTFNYIGDSWQNSYSPFRAITDVVAAERGRFFINRAGTAVFWNRQHLQLKDTNDGTISDTMYNMGYTYGSDIRNEIIVPVKPRSISADNTALIWQLDEAFTLGAGKEKKIRARYSEQDGEGNVAAKDVQVPTVAAGTLSVTGDVSLRMVSEAKSAELIFTNNSATEEATVSTVVLKGQKITTYNQYEVRSEDAFSISTYGRRPYSIPTGLLDDEQTAEYIASYELSRFKDPAGQVDTIDLRNKDAATLTQQLARTVGDRVRIVESQTEHDEDYFIMGESHSVSDGLKLHRTIWYLEPASRSLYWLIGTSGRGEIGQTTYVGF